VPGSQYSGEEKSTARPSAKSSAGRNADRKYAAAYIRAETRRRPAAAASRSGGSADVLVRRPERDDGSAARTRVVLGSSSLAIRSIAGSVVGTRQ